MAYPVLNEGFLQAKHIHTTIPLEPMHPDPLVPPFLLSQSQYLLRTWSSEAEVSCASN